MYCVVYVKHRSVVVVVIVVAFCRDWHGWVTCAYSRRDISVAAAVVAAAARG